MARGLEKNLKPQSMRTKDEQRRIASAGGIASGKARRERKRFKDELLALLALPSEVREGVDRQLSLLIAQLNKAELGDKDAAVFVRDTIGEKPTDKLEHSGDLKHEHSLPAAVNEIIARLGGKVL